MGTKRTAEFRHEAVRVVASDFGIGFSTLSKWMQQDGKNPVWGHHFNTIPNA